MRIVARIAVALALACWPLAAQAQVPYIVGTWELDAAASDGGIEYRDVRSYRLRDDGVLIGLAVLVSSEGAPYFLQFAAKPDGTDYPEFDADSAAEYLASGAPPPRTYAEVPTDDPRRVRWIDKRDGVVIASGEKWVSEDGETLTVTLDATNEQGEAVQYVYVYNRTGP